MEITFLGTSCMVPTVERNHQSIFISYKSDGILIDCGEGTQRQLKIAKIKPTKISKIFITHWHGDHVLGLPGLLQTLSSSDYDRKLEIYGPKGTIKNFEYMFKAFNFNISFEHKIIEIKEDKIELKNLYIESLELDHGVPCIGYTIREKDVRKIKTNIIKKLNIPEGPLLGELQNNKSIEFEGKTISPIDTTYLIKGKKLAIVVDTKICNNAYILAKNSDLLISEASYVSDLENKAEEYKHLTAKQAALLASQSNTKKLILTHLSQRYKSPEIILEDAKNVFENVIVAFDFMKVKL